MAEQFLHELQRFPAESDTDTKQDLTASPPDQFPPADEDMTPRELILSGPVTGTLNYLREIKRRCDDYCTRLLQPDIAQITMYVFSNLVTPGPNTIFMRNRSDDCVVALSICIASNLTCQPLTPGEIVAVIRDADECLILGLYTFLRDEVPWWQWLIDEGMREDLEENFDARSAYI